MDQATATLIAGIVAAVGSTTVGVVALVIAAKNTKRTLVQQREEAEFSRRASAEEEARRREHEWQKTLDQRLWDRRTETYLSLLAWLGDDAPTIPFEYIEPYRIGRGDPDLVPGPVIARPDANRSIRKVRSRGVPTALRARVQMFASDKVVALVDRMHGSSWEEEDAVAGEHEQLGELDTPVENWMPTRWNSGDVDDPDNDYEEPETKRDYWNLAIAAARQDWNHGREDLLNTIREEYPEVGQSANGSEEQLKN